MEELRKALKAQFGPHTDGDTFLTVRYYCGFEGHGRASETWEPHWQLELPQVPDIRFTRKGNFNVKFHGRTFEDVKREALEYIASQQAG